MATQLDAWIAEWNKVCDEALEKIRKGEGDVAGFVEDAVRGSKIFSKGAKEALAGVVRLLLSLGEDALASGIELARQSGIFGLRLRALFS